MWLPEWQVVVFCILIENESAEEVQSFCWMLLLKSPFSNIIFKEAKDKWFCLGDEYDSGYTWVVYV